MGLILIYLEKMNSFVTFLIEKTGASQILL